MPVLSERTNVIVMADEAHRSQYATFAREHHTGAAERDQDRVHRHAGRERRPIDPARLRRLRLGLPHAPGAGGPRDGPDLLRVAPDPARRSPIPSSSRRSRTCSKTEEQEAASKLVTAWAKLEKVVGAPDRLEKLADDVARTLHGALRGARGQGDGRRVLPPGRRRTAGLLGERFGDEAVDMRDLGAGDRPTRDVALPALKAGAARS